MSTTPLLTVKDVADRLAVSQSTVYDLAATGKLSCYRIGSRGRGVVRFTEEQVAAYLSACLVIDPPDDDGPLEHIR